MIQAQIVYVSAQRKVTALTLPPHGASIGRAAGCTIVAEDPQISQQHAVLKLIRDAWHIEDQRSTNGTLVNRSRITAPTRLRHCDIIECGSLQLRFVLISGSEQATLADWKQEMDGGPSSDFSSLRSEVNKVKQERDELLEKLEQQSRALSGANTENRQLRQVQDELRAQHATLRKSYEQGQAAENVLTAEARRAAAEKDRATAQAAELKDQLRALRAELQEHREARHQAELEAQRIRERIESAEADCERLARAKEEAVGAANQRQADVEALSRLRGDWERYKLERDSESRISAARISELLAELDKKQSTLRTIQGDLSSLRERYEEKNAQHRGLRTEFDQLNAELTHHQDRAKRQIERLAKDKEALHTQLQSLKIELEKAQKSAPREPAAGAVPQLVPELCRTHDALLRENEQLRSFLTRTLRWYTREVKTNGVDPTAAKVRDSFEMASSHAEQTHKLLQELGSSCAVLSR